MINFHNKQDLHVGTPSGLGMRGAGANLQYTWLQYTAGGINTQGSNGGPSGGGGGGLGGFSGFTWSGEFIITAGSINTTLSGAGLAAGSDPGLNSLVGATGTGLYSGAGTNYFLRIYAPTNGTGAASVTIVQDMVPIILVNAGMITGPFPQDFPFTMAAGINSVIDCPADCECPPGDPVNILSFDVVLA